MWKGKNLSSGVELCNFFNSRVKFYTSLSYNYDDTIFNYHTASCMYEGLFLKLL